MAHIGSSTDSLGGLLSIPPQWIRLTVAVRYVVRDYGIPTDEAHNRLCRDIQAGLIDHRISGMPVDPLDLIQPPDGLGAKQIEGSLFSATVFVVDWTAIRVNWEKGTIRVRGKSANYIIDVYWPDVEKRSAERNSLKKGLGGRPPKYDWLSFAREMIRLAQRPDGLPEEHDELVRHMLQWCEDEWGNSPSESTVRYYVAKLDPRET
jgi:hypothetical protein